jgi:hypothetical protein
VGLRGLERHFLRAVDLAGKVVALESFSFKDLGPLGGFQGHPVGAGQSGGDKADLMALPTIRAAYRFSFLI